MQCWAQHWDQHTRDWSKKCHKGEHLILRRDWESCYCSAWGREGSDAKLNSAYKHLMGRCNERQSETGQETLGTNWITRCIQTWQQHFFIVRVSKFFNRLFREGVEVSSPGDASNLTGLIPGQSAPIDTALHRGIRLNALQRWAQHLLFYKSMACMKPHTKCEKLGIKSILAT